MDTNKPIGRVVICCMAIELDGIRERRYTAVMDDILVGVLTAKSIAPQQVSFCQFFVAEPFRKLGIGSGLIKAAMANEGQWATLGYLLARPEKTEWYRKQGFIPIKEESGHVRMEAWLPPKSRQAAERAAQLN